MSKGAHLQRLPQLVSPRKMAYSGLILDGKVEPQSLQRLQEAVEAVIEVEAQVAFHIGDEGKVEVSGSIKAMLSYLCQRCLQAIEPSALNVDLSTAVVRNEDEAKQLSKSLDPWIVAEEEADLYSYIEEELLLALPVVAYHEHECIDKRLLQSGEASSDEDKQQNPFGVLASLKDKSSKQ